MEIVWRHDPVQGFDERHPATASEARERLDCGNAAFAAVGEAGGRHVVSVGPEAFGLPRTPGEGVPHEPFAAVLGCSDARVPVELVFGQAATTSSSSAWPATCRAEVVGSLDYAIEHLPSMRLIVVLGHTSCGAVTAAVDAFLAPSTYLQLASNPALRAIVDALLAAVRMGDAALEVAHGHAAAVGRVPASVDRPDRGREHSRHGRRPAAGGRGVEIAFGVFDVVRRTVGCPPPPIKAREAVFMYELSAALGGKRTQEAAARTVAQQIRRLFQATLVNVTFQPEKDAKSIIVGEPKDAAAEWQPDRTIPIENAWGLVGEIQIWRGPYADLPAEDSRILRNFAWQTAEALERTRAMEIREAGAHSSPKTAPV